MVTPAQYIASAEKHKGKPYVFGAKGPNEFDCSGLVTAAGAALGVVIPHGSKNQIEFCIGIDLEEGINTPGALLYKVGHDAISKGDGTTIEARNPKDGIGNFKATGRGFTHAGLIPGIDYTKVSKVAVTMVSPVVGRIGSKYGWRTLNGKARFHNGQDIPTGAVGVPVYSAFAGTVSNVVTNRVHDTTTAQVKNQGKAVVRSGNTGNGCRVNNPDGEVQTYIHMKPVVKNGQKVTMGQLLGHIDLSGYTTGPHLHLDMRNSNGEHKDPAIWFKAHRITMGSIPVFPPKPKATPKVTSFLPLAVDGGEGHRTVTEEQRALKKTKDYQGIIEEDSKKTAVRGPELLKGFQRFYQRAGYYTGKIDADFAARSITAEQRWLKKKGYYKGIIEADLKKTPVRGPEQIKAIQRALNAGAYK